MLGQQARRFVIKPEAKPQHQVIGVMEIFEIVTNVYE